MNRLTQLSYLSITYETGGRRWLCWLSVRTGIEGKERITTHGTITLMMSSVLPQRRLGYYKSITESLCDKPGIDFKRCWKSPAWEGLKKRCYCCILGTVGASVFKAWLTRDHKSGYLGLCCFSFVHYSKQKLSIVSSLTLWRCVLMSSAKHDELKMTVIVLFVSWK